jgi:hypothetical protein
LLLLPGPKSGSANAGAVTESANALASSTAVIFRRFISHLPSAAWEASYPTGGRSRASCAGLAVAVNSEHLVGWIGESQPDPR